MRRPDGSAPRFLPMSRPEMRERGWAEPDVLLISGDAYVDHPSFGVAVIGRVLEAAGYRVGIVAQPDWRRLEDFTALGRPRLFVGISAGNVDSLVANYTANRKPRRDDHYSPGDRAGLRPDRATIVYANRAREAFGRIPLVLGGLEASLRRLAHYDYWEDAVRRSLLLDAKADVLVYGMGEQAVLEIAARLAAGQGLEGIRGTVTASRGREVRGGGRATEGEAAGCYAREATDLTLPSFEAASADPQAFNEAFRLLYANLNPFTARRLLQQHGDRCVIHNPPAFPLPQAELDRVHELPYAREAHPAYGRAGRAGRTGIRALETVRFSMVSHRGCCGECSFCGLAVHQGRFVTSRSAASLLREARALSERPDFKGTITDIGGPTANMYAASCPRWSRQGFCADRSCLTPEVCGSLRLGYAESLEVYRQIRALPRVRHLFIASGFRHDLLVEAAAEPYLREVLEHHISGQMKVAPEHTVDRVLALMNKAPFAQYERFLAVLQRLNRPLARRIYLVNYFISAHPGSGAAEAAAMARWLRGRRMSPQQVQDYLPLPMTVSGCMWHTGVHPLTGEAVYVPRSARERRDQRALIQGAASAGATGR